MNGVSIQEPKKGDFKNMFHLLSQLWPEKKLDRAKEREIFLKQKNRFFVAKKHNKIIGLACLKITVNGLIGRITKLIVAKEFHGKGVGKKLLHETIKLAKERSCKLVFLTCSSKRETARKFYKFNNFKRVGFLHYQTV